MNIGCFALIQPFSAMSTQFQLIRKLGLDTADITDNHDGATLGVEYGFSASVSLDSHPAKVREMAKAAGITLTAFCAHANLLDPTSPLHLEPCPPGEEPVAVVVSLPFFLVRPAFEGMGRGRPGLVVAALRYVALTAPAAWLGIRAADAAGWPAIVGLVLGLIVASALASGVFLAWIRRALREAGDSPVGGNPGNVVS